MVNAFWVHLCLERRVAGPATQSAGGVQFRLRRNCRGAFAQLRLHSGNPLARRGMPRPSSTPKRKGNHAFSET
jgi:hypothetical protein